MLYVFCLYPFVMITTALLCHLVTSLLESSYNEFYKFSQKILRYGFHFNCSVSVFHLDQHGNSKDSPRLYTIPENGEYECSNQTNQNQTVFYLASVVEDVGTENLAPVPMLVKNKVCQVNFDDERIQLVSNKSDLKMIYFVTPTYPRPEQVPELTRLAHTLMHVPRLHWIVADDQPLCSDQVSNILRRSGLPYTHISSPKPYVYKVGTIPRGVANRRVALSWLLANVHGGVLYFGDDDNTVDLQLFDEIRNTKRVSMFPVGLIGGYGVSAPIVKNGKVVGFFDSWPAARRFPVDMAGFAVNIEFLKPSATMPYIAGHEEDMFLISLDVKLDDIEPLAENCSKVLVWHTKTLKYPKPTLKININQYDKELSPKYESFVNLLKEVSRQGMAVLDAATGTQTLVIRDRKTYEILNGLK